MEPSSRGGGSGGAPAPGAEPCPEAAQPGREPHGEPGWLQQVEGRLGYRFAAPALVRQAFTHRSVRASGGPSNERLEFLGDAVLGLLVAEELYRRYPDWPEGELTRVRSVVVSAPVLARALQRLGLVEAIRLGKSLRWRGRLPPSLLACVFEALLGAIYLDGGLEPARRLLERALAGEIEAAARRRCELNWKSLLQQLAQRDLGELPRYRLLAASGPEHERCFEVVALLGEREFGRGRGRTKKAAEQAAAEATLRRLLGPRLEELRSGVLPPLAPAPGTAPPPAEKG
ncbi:MAG: hypothetical protein KatS3mg102_1090 [Planctomycetota bacterium]|nr:MAG: hypothetical protein KatS3mg102_1090 [Planctomycetota bacterium]